MGLIRDVIKNVDQFFKMRKNLPAKKKGMGSTVEDTRIWHTLRTYLSSVDSMEVTDPYEKSVWVFAAVNAIAQNISRVPFYIYKEKSKDIKDIISEGPLHELMQNPNPYMITSTLFFATALYLELFGEAFWLVERKNITEIPKYIWVIPPTRMEPVIKDNQFHGYWKHTLNNVETIFAPHEILHFKYYNPYDDIRGLSAIEASKSGVEQDFFANKYNKQFFKDGIALSGIISVPEFLPNEVYKRMVDQFQERHGGAERAHKVGIIEGGAEFVETKAMSQKEMEFSVLKKVIRGEILAAFKINEVVLGNYENIQSYEGIKNAHESFWKETLLPKIIYIEDFLWAKFYSKLENGKYWGGFDLSVVEALREDFGQKVDIAVKLYEIGFSANEINKRLDLGFEERPWRNTWWIKTGMIPVENALDFIPDPNAQPDEPKKPDEGKTPADEESKKPDEGKDIDLSQREDSMWANYLARQGSVEILFKKKIKRFLYEQRKRILTNIYQGNEVVFDEKIEMGSFLESVSGLYLISSQEGLDLFKEEFTFDEVTESCKQKMNTVIQERTGFSSRTVTATLKKKLEKILIEKDTKVKANKIRAFYNKVDNIALRIARTESAYMINTIRFVLMENSGVQYHKWISRSEKGRHDKFNGKVVRIGDSFSNDFTIRYPLDNKAPIDEIIMCRCYCVPIVKIK
jgi:HK97 family phage portal protein